jgi:hypothetical protein
MPGANTSGVVRTSLASRCLRVKRGWTHPVYFCVGTGRTIRARGVIMGLEGAAGSHYLPWRVVGGSDSVTGGVAARETGSRVLYLR